MPRDWQASVGSFLLALLAGVLPMLALTGLLPRKYFGFSYLALGTVLQRTLMLDVRIASLLVCEFEVRASY